MIISSCKCKVCGKDIKYQKIRVASGVYKLEVQLCEHCVNGAYSDGKEEGYQQAVGVADRGRKVW